MKSIDPNIMGKKRSKQKKQQTAEDIYAEMYSDMDGTFAFIAGYTPGSAPYGVTWEEVGINSELPFEEKVRLYRRQMDASVDELTVDDNDELPFVYSGKKNSPLSEISIA